MIKKDLLEFKALTDYELFSAKKIVDGKDLITRIDVINMNKEIIDKIHIENLSNKKINKIRTDYIIKNVDALKIGQKAIISILLKNKSHNE